VEKWGPIEEGNNTNGEPHRQENIKKKELYSFSHEQKTKKLAGESKTAMGRVSHHYIYDSKGTSQGSYACSRDLYLKKGRKDERYE